ncbi:hypothetical protein [Nocardia wallacei]|uniref:hypothetical protein n=1 Tax=Nocardia wallacei TaxID=480035 RepID=UPI002458D8F6|nr:hypothetical protein [Nocardia wallacei]
MPDDYDAARRNLSNYERGLYFELGRAHIRGETPEKGWVRQFEINVGGKIRRLDSARTEGRGVRSRERKSGRVHERETLEQLRRERAALRTGQLTQSGWETVAGEKVPRTVRDELQQMARDFPGRFHHEVISRADALRALELGRSLAAQQLELVRSYQLSGADRARKRLANIREIVRQREVQAKEDRARTEREAREARQRVEREAAERVIREFRLPEVLRRDREEKDAGRVQAREAADEAAAQARARLAQEAVDKAERQRQRDAAERLAAFRQQAREAAAAGRVIRGGPEIADLLIVGHATPGAEPLHREPPHPGPTRGGRDERGRERGIERTRD